MDSSIVFARSHPYVPPSNTVPWVHVSMPLSNSISIGSAIFAGPTALSNPQNTMLFNVRDTTHTETHSLALPAMGQWVSAPSISKDLFFPQIPLYPLELQITVRCIISLHFVQII